MTATHPTRPAPRRPVVVRPAGFRPLIVDVAWSEWTKLRTVRSTYWTLVAAAVGMVAFGALLCAAYVNHYAGLSPADRATFDAAGYSLSGFFLTQLAIGTLGVVAMTSEYATGSVRATFTAAPQRRTVLAAKAAIFGAVAAATGVISALMAFLVGQGILARKGIQAHLGDPGALRSVLGAGLYLAVLGLLALGLGALIRRTAGAMATLVGLVLILPVLIQGLPQAWQNAVTKYLPSTAGQAIIGRTKFTPHGHLLGPWAGFGLLCAYTTATLVAAAITLNRRDA